MKRSGDKRENLETAGIKVEREKTTRLAEVARWYYINELSQKDIADRLGYKDASAVTRLLKEARERGVVEFDVDGMFAIGGYEETQLARNLRDDFGLDDALVIKVNVLQSYSRAEDDYLHIALANHTGMRVKDRIEPAEHIAVGGGRAVYQTARVIKRSPPSRKNIRITPLGGKIWTRFWEVSGTFQINRPLDADDAARMLALAFEGEPGTAFSQVTYPLFANSPEDATATMESHCMFLPDGSWRGSPPGRALVGVGVIDPEGGHRFADLLRPGDQPEEIAPYLSRAAGELKTAIEFVRAKDLPPIGDVNNRLFPALPIPDRKLDSSFIQERTAMYEDLLRHLTRLNQRMISAKWDHLRRIPSVMAIAGGPFKLNALWTLLITGVLDPSNRIIKALSTDAQSASRLIRALKAYNEDPATKEWYQILVNRLF